MTGRAYWALAALIVASVLAVHGRGVFNGFVEFDDPAYIAGNAAVNQGVTPAAVRLAFFTAQAGNWHPVTWLTHMLDWQVFGDKAAGHHAVGVVWHAINAVLVFAVLVRYTGAPFHGAACALLFALHPLRVESVAWASSRKDLTSGCFFLVTLLFYHRYAIRRSALGYASVAAAFALSLMSKAMVVTLPFVLLLLDFWPLRRLPGPPGPGRAEAARSVVLEKIPLLGLSALASAITFAAQRSFGAVGSTEQFPLPTRLAHAAAGYLFYLQKTFVPTGLAAIYPYSDGGGHFPRAAMGATVVCAITVAAWCCRDKAPYALTGWLWFIGMLVPVIGVVQVGSQAYADRFSYLPHIGLLMALVWSIAAMVARRPALRAASWPAMGVVLMALGGMTWAQTGYWRDSLTLFGHAVEAVPRNPIALSNLGLAQMKAGQLPEAERSFLALTELVPQDAAALANLGSVYLRMGRLAEAESASRAALDASPNEVSAISNLGTIVFRKNQYFEASALFERAVSLAPQDKTLLLNWAAALGALGRTVEARTKAEAALAIDPNFAMARRFLDALDGTTPNP